VPQQLELAGHVSPIALLQQEEPVGIARFPQQGPLPLHTNPTLEFPQQAQP
jgi:hypothetical protein